MIGAFTLSGIYICYFRWVWIPTYLIEEKKSELNKTGLKISREKILSLMKNVVTFAQFYFS